MHEPFPQKIDRFGKSLLSYVMIFANTWTHKYVDTKCSTHFWWQSTNLGLIFELYGKNLFNKWWFHRTTGSKIHRSGTLACVQF